MKKQIVLSTIFVTVLICVTHVSLSAQTITTNKTKLDKKIDSLFKAFNNTSSPGYATVAVRHL